MLLEVAAAVASGSTICCQFHKSYKSYKRVDSSMRMKPMGLAISHGRHECQNQRKHQGRTTDRLKVGRSVHGMTSPPGAGHTRLAL